MLLYGGGSIKHNGVYDQVIAALKGFSYVEFGGIEPNPRYETMMKALELAKKENVTFLLPVGGGSVIDGTKFLAAAMFVPEGTDPWGILQGTIPVTKALPLGTVLTLPLPAPNEWKFRSFSKQYQRKTFIWQSIGNAAIFDTRPVTCFRYPTNKLLTVL